MRKIIFLLLIIVFLPPNVFASESKSGENWRGLLIQKNVIKSKILGSDIRLQIVLPEQYETTVTSFPVFYYLDAFYNTGTVTEINDSLLYGKEIPPIITVGIDTGANTWDEWFKKRAYILTPTKSDKDENETGGGPLFLECLEKEIIPFVEKTYRVNPNNRTIYGHSYGGLFSLYVIFKKPQLFSKYLVSSPSLPWDNRLIFKMESEYVKNHSDLPIKLFLSVGALENEPEDMMVYHLEELAEVLRLRKYKGLEINSIVFEGESHSSVVPMAISKGLRVLYSSEMITSDVNQNKKE